MLKVTNVSVNTLREACGIRGVPEIGWMLESDRRNVLQKSYRLQIAENPSFAPVVWDSETVLDGESVHIRPEGFRPASSRNYWVRIKSSDGTEESAWSEAAHFLAALQAPADWKARLISAETDADAENSKGTLLRREFDVPSPVVSAVIHSTALGLYRLYLNGERVGCDELTPGWTSYRTHLLVQTYDVTDLISCGRNAIGAMVGAGWFKGTMGFLGLRNNYGKRTALLVQLELFFADGSCRTVTTDLFWKCADSPVLFSEIYDGETYDARLEISGWKLAGFNDSGWRSAAPAEWDFSALCPQAGCRVRGQERFPAKRVFRTPEGDTVVDFGQNISGWVQFCARGRSGDRVVLQHFETLDAAGNVYLKNLRSAKQTVTYFLKGGAEEHFHPHFTFQGFRYVWVAEYPGEVLAKNFEAVAVYSKLRETGGFTCSEPALNQLQHNIMWSMKDNFVDVPTDCPQRNERMGWTGDAQIFCRTAGFLADTDLFFRKWLTDVAADQTPEGGIPHVVPDIISGKEQDDWLLSQGTHSAAAWADAAVIIPWTLYLTYGDRQVLADQFESMKKWIDFMRTHANGIIWNYKLQFGDWVALDAQEGSYFGATPNDLTCTAYYAYSTGLFAKICRILGRNEEYKTYSALRDEITDGFRKAFFREDGSMAAQTQTAHILALYFHLAPERFAAQTADALVRLLREHDGHLVTGFVGTPYFCHALSESGHVKEAYELLLKEDFPSWLYQVKAGATTIWEHWDGIRPDGTMWSPDMNSFNHYAYGAVGDWLYRAAAGICLDEERPGGRHTRIFPRIGERLTFVRASFDSVYGPISAGWRTENGAGVRLEVSLPPNTDAQIVLDGAKTVTDSAGLRFVPCEEGMCTEAGSGSYSIRFER